MITKRILQIIEYKGINKSKFYSLTGLSNGFLDKVKDIGSSKIEQILNTFTDINPIWLITGKGEMIQKDETEVTKHNERLNEIESLTADEKERVYSLIDLLIRDIKERK